MNREFTKIGNQRFVKAVVFNLHVYHPECAPKNASEPQWFTTRHSSCAGCYQPLFKKGK